ncbi:MAG: signal recognition particle-docking protein FtsY [Magnetospirillum sp.]|nr:signal recognition particle-docking protein FtsY [Magnetospirillum sp.]
MSKKGFFGRLLGGGAAADAEPAPAPVPAPETEASWFARMKGGLSKSSSRLTQGLTDLFTKRKLDDEALEELEELLITADLGVATAGRVTRRLAKSRFGEDIDADEIKAALAEEITAILAPVARPLAPDFSRKPHVVLVVGVNGSGKTTTIGKLAKHYRDQGRTVLLAAGDTFRAAAVEQLKVWGERTGCPVIARDTGADAAGLVFDALAQAQAEGADLLFIDTAGRLQNKTDLMDELKKVVRVIKKNDESAPHDVLLVLDATVGQNAHSQVEVFKEMVSVTGLVLTKLDGTARGGVLVALAEKFGLPVHAIGVGEQAGDLRPFAAAGFARSLVGLE